MYACIIEKQVVHPPQKIKVKYSRKSAYGRIRPILAHTFQVSRFAAETDYNTASHHGNKQNLLGPTSEWAGWTNNWTK